MNRQDDLIGIVLLSMCFAVLMASWMYWVNQRDEFLGEVMDCMVEVTEFEYNRCATTVAEEHQRQINAGG